MPQLRPEGTRVNRGARVQHLGGIALFIRAPVTGELTLAQEAEVTHAEDRTLRPKSARPETQHIQPEIPTW